eukprot:sb/3462041/
MGSDSFQTVELADIGVNQPVNSIKSAGRSLLIGAGEKGSVFINFKDGTPRAVKVIEKGAIAQVVGSDQMIMVSDTTVSLVQISNGFVHHSYTLETNRGRVVSIAPLSVSHPCTTISSVKVPGVFLTWSDQSIMVTGDNDSCTWIREESLASVTTATLMDLPSISLNPLTHQRSTSGNPFTAWVDRIQSQFLDLNKMINIYFGTAHVDASPDMERDSFNLNKLIVTMTTVGKVHVLHSKGGRLVCSRLISGIKPFDNGKYQMHVTRTSSHYPLSANVVILASSVNGTNTVLTVINPLDCSIEYRHQFPSKLMQAQLTPIEDEDYSKILVLLTADKKVHTFPPHSSLASVPLFFTVLDGQTLTGYKVVEVSSMVEETWSTHVRGDSVLSVVSKDQNDAVYSQGRALGDRSVLHKYINPNVMAIAVESTDKGHVDILVYDMVTGEQVYFSRHKQYSGPAHVLLSENWLVYHLWNTKLRRYEVTVVEFYLDTPPKASEFSSLASQYKISTLQQSYISISPLNTLETTTTLKSITNRAILFAETGGRIAVVPKALLDPRRPAKPTAADKMEGLLPYSPQIVVPPISYLTFNKTCDDVIRQCDDVIRQCDDGIRQCDDVIRRGDSVLSVVSKDQNDAVYSQGRALGDRSVLHKYINPNVMAIAVESTDKGHVDILVYDMVTGEQVYFSRHKQYSGPAHVLLSENWLVYHLWNTKLRRYEVTVVEFYLDTPPKASEFSSLASQYKISTLQQSYISISPLNTLETTTTLKSITNRAILFAETGGRIAVVPKALLDPRRPAKPTAADKMEGLLPYSPQIVVPPISYLTFNKTVSKWKGQAVFECTVGTNILGILIS